MALSASRFLKSGFLVILSLSILVVIFSVQAQGDVPPLATEEPAPLSTQPAEPPAPLPMATTEPPAPTTEVTPPTQETLPTEETFPTAETTATATQPILPLVYSANFDTGYPDGLTSNVGWALVDLEGENKALQPLAGAQPFFYTTSVSQSAAQARFYLVSGEAQVLLRGYTAGLNANGQLTVYHNGTVVSSANLTLASSTWHTLRVQVIGSSLEVSVDGVSLINITTQLGLTWGLAGVSALEGSSLRVDDFDVFSATIATPTPQTLNTATPSKTNTPVSTATPTKTVTPIPMPIVAPINVQVTRSGNVNTVTWTDNNNDESAYIIMRYPTFGEKQVAADNPSFQDTVSVCNMTVFYRVLAYKNDGNAYSEGRYSPWVPVITNPCAAEPAPPPTCVPTALIQRINVSMNGKYQTSHYPIHTISNNAGISYNGRYILFSSAQSLENVWQMPELGSELGVVGFDLYRFDRQTCSTLKVSIGDTENESKLPAEYGAMSDDGNLVVFGSASLNLTNEGYTGQHLFVRNINAGTTERIPFTDPLAPGDLLTPRDITADGRYVLFDVVGYGSYAANDFNIRTYVYDRDTDTYLYTQPTSTYNTPGVSIFTANGKVYALQTREYTLWLLNITDTISTQISGQNMFSTLGGVAINGTTLTVAFTNGNPDATAYIRNVDLVTQALGPTTVVSRQTGVNGAIMTKVHAASISSDGRWVTFSQQSADYKTIIVYVRDLVTNTTQAVSGTTTANAKSIGLGFSGDGKYIVFASESASVVSGDTNNLCETDFLGNDFNESCNDVFITKNPFVTIVPPTATPTLTPRPAVVAPSNLSASVSATLRLTLRWQDNSNDETSFRVEQLYNAATSTYTIAANTTIYAQTVPCVATLQYRVRAHRTADNTYSAWTDWVSVTTPPCPTPTSTATYWPLAAPSNIQVALLPGIGVGSSYSTPTYTPGPGVTLATATATSTANHHYMVKVTWQDNAQDESNYQRERLINTSSTLVSYAANTVEFNDPLMCGTTASYRVRATRSASLGGATSAWTDWVSITVPPCDAIITQSAALTLTAAAQITPTATPQTGETTSEPTPDVTLEPIASLTATATAWVLPAPSNFQVVQAQGAGSESIFLTNTNTPPPGVTLATTAATITPSTFYMVALSWQDNALDETAYQIERMRETVIVAWNAAANSVQFIDSLYCNTSAAYRVRAYRASDQTFSDWTSWTIIVMPSCDGTATAPTATPQTGETTSEPTPDVTLEPIASGTPSPTDTTASFSCALVSVSLVSFSGQNTLYAEISNNNTLDTTYLSASLVWNYARLRHASTGSPQAYAGFVSIDNQVNWTGYQNEADEPTLANPVDTTSRIQGDSFMDDDPANATDVYLPDINVTIPAEGMSRWQLTYLALVKPLYQNMDLWEWAGTTLTFTNPTTGVPCVVPLNVPNNPNPPTATATNTVGWQTQQALTATALANLTTTSTPWTGETTSEPTLEVTLTASATPIQLTAPILVSPANDILTSSRRATLIWNIVPGANEYNLQIAKTVNFTVLIHESLRMGGIQPGDGTVIAQVGPLMPQGEYWWRVRARTSSGQFSGWSEIRRVEVNIAESPANNSIVVASASTGTAEITFRWRDNKYSNEHYELAIASNAGFSQVINVCMPTTDASCGLTLPIGTYYWKVAIVSDKGVSRSLSPFKITISQGIPAAIVPITPPNGEFVSPFEQGPTLSWGWSTVPDSTTGFTYEVELDRQSDFSTQALMSFDNLTETSFTLPILSDNTYFWRVRALNANDIPGPWSAVWRFSVDTTPPAAPILTQPTENMLYSVPRPTFKWTAVAGASGYQVAIGYPEGTCDAASSYWVAEQVTTTSYTMKAPMPQDTFQVCVRAYDQVSNFSAANGPVTFRIFLGTQPLDGAFISATTHPVFRWTAAPVPAGSNITINYTVQIDNDDDLNNGLQHTSPVLSVNTTAYTMTDLLPAGVYRWRVVRVGSSYDENLRVPEWRTLIIGGLSAGPELLAPTHNQVINGPVSLNWDAASAPFGTNIDSYEVVISRSASFSAALSTTQIVSDLSRDFTPLDNQNRVTYYWRVRGLWDGLPVTTWSARSFVIDNVGPNAPVITSPANNALLNVVRPTITWASVSTAINYTVGITNAVTGEDLMDEKIVTGNTYKPDFNLPQGPVTIRVRANDSINPSAWSYMTVNVRLGTLPAQNVIVNTARPTFTWTPVIGAAGYTLQIDNDSFFDDVASGGDGQIYRTINLGAVTSYTLRQSEELTQQGTYYWRLMPSNGAYPYGTASRAFYRAVASTLKPSGLESSVETQNALPSLSYNTAAGLVTMRWRGITPTPLQYEIQIGTTSAFGTAGLAQRFSTDPTVVIDPTQLEEGLKYWRVRGLYSADGTSYGPWSDVRNFAIDRTPPAPPMISGALTSTVSTLRPGFKWFPSIGASSYVLYISDESTGDPVAGLDGVSIKTTSYTAPAALNQNNTAGYRWSVQAFDAAGNVSGMSLNPTVYLFSGISPKKGQIVTTLTPTFQWSAVTGSGAAPWILEIARDAQMTNMVYASPAPLAATATRFVLPATAKLTPGTYYWRVYRTTENTSTIQGQAFSVNALASLTPQLLTPANASALNAAQMAASPVFTWAAQKPGTPATASSVQSYRFEMAKAATFAPASIVYTQEVTGATQIALPPLPLPDGTYYWRVQARYTADMVGPYSVTHTVRIDQTLPNRSVLLSPASRVVFPNTQSPTLTWSAATGATGYVIEVASDLDFTQVRLTKTLTSTTRSFIATNLANGQYYWRVIAKDGVGNLNATPARSFTIAVP